MGGERLLDFHWACLARRGGCTWEETRAAIEQAYLGLLAGPPALAPGHGGGPGGSAGPIVAWDLHVEQVPDRHRAALSEWLACNSVTVVHTRRNAIIESFLSEQMEVSRGQRTRPALQEGCSRASHSATGLCTGFVQACAAVLCPSARSVGACNRASMASTRPCRGLGFKPIQRQHVRLSTASRSLLCRAGKRGADQLDVHVPFQRSGKDPRRQADAARPRDCRRVRARQRGHQQSGQLKKRA